MRFALTARRAFSPLDEELQLVPGHLTPSLQEASVRLSTWMPFARAAKEFQWFTHVTVTEPLTRRLAEAAGAAYVQFQTVEVERLERTTPEPPEGPALQLLSVDGATVPLVHGEWGEVKTMVVGTVQPPVLEKGEWVVHSTDLSYFSRLTDAETFTRLATVETHRRGVERAGRVCGVTDGAVWEQGFLDVQRQDAIRILDFPHATEYLTPAGQVVHGEDTPELKTWLTDSAHELKHGSPDRVLDQLRAMHQDVTARSAAQGEIIADSLSYLEKRRAHIEYAQFQAAGYPIGSGAVESGNKVVVEARLKGAGMHWARAHVNPMLALRNIPCSDRWEEAWPEIERQRRQQDRLAREQRRQQRRLKRPAVTAMPQSSCPEDVRPVRSTSVSHPVEPTNMRNPSGRAHRPADNHPCRHSPIGRAVFLPKKRPSSAKE
jgi:hypothetical protein